MIGMIVPACSTRRVLEMPPLGCWLACPVIWKLVLAYHNSAYKRAILCVAVCSSRGFRMRNRVTCIGTQEARNAPPPKKKSPQIFFYFYNPIQFFGHLGPGCRLVVFLEGNRHNRPEYLLFIHPTPFINQR